MSATIATEGDTTSASPKIVSHGEATTCGDLATNHSRIGFSTRSRTQHSAFNIQQGYDN
jgi:hypothetical protein